ncbi:ankyrin repeat-containing domain protein [Aspergillus sergii]|uniref:Ankyrin repeat-containing domain protein n=1 Tax=Aspergillus sergii TaxID=1034303 RepID=A0A5N6WQ89_9EURO|nr:ankyrin repeat-containing domain protein [Aspergillus sergii]
MDIYKAASQGSIDAIKVAVEQGYDVDGPNKDGKTPLWFAVQSGQAEACRFLMSLGATVEAQNPSILEVAVRGGHADIVALLWPHCNAERAYRSLESAISLGFHEIADFMIETGAFEYRNSEVSGTESLIKDGFPERESTVYQQWERFLFVRRGQELPLHRILCDYALLLAAKAGRNAGLRLVRFLLGESMADVNCKIVINGQFETPLTAAAEKGNLEILATLVDHPSIDLTICGKYNWPAFLHLLASPLSISTERGRVIARQLAYKAAPNRFFIDSREIRLQGAFQNVLQFGDDNLVKQVIELVRGAAGVLVLPLLIRANEVDGLTWVLNSDAVSSKKPPPAFWVLLCQYFERHQDQDALGLFTHVTEFLVEKEIWNQAILKCLHARHFSFIQQFFYPLSEAPPKEVTEETLVGFPAASTDPFIIQEWSSQGFARVALWNAIHCGLWKSPNFENLLFSNADLNGPDPHPNGPGRPEPEMIPHAFFDDPSRAAQMTSLRPAPPPAGPNPPNPFLHSYQMQLIRLEQQNKRRLVIAGDTRSPLSWAATSHNAPLVDALLLSPQVSVNSRDSHDRTALMYAIAVNDRPIVERLLNHRDIDLNLQDVEGRTAIFYAAQGEDLSIVQLLVGTQKVDFSIRNRNGQNVREFAKQAQLKQDVVTALSN